MGSVQKRKELKQRRQRRAKLHTLRKKYVTAKTEDEKTLVLNKAARVAPWLTQEEFLSPIK